MSSGMAATMSSSPAHWKPALCSFEVGNRGGIMAPKRRRIAPRYAVNISLKAWDIAKAGAAVTLKVRDRDDLLEQSRLAREPSAGKAHGERRVSSALPGGSWLTNSMTSIETSYLE